MSASFVLQGLAFNCFNAGPYFQFSEGISLYVDCADQAEVDYYWQAFCAEGTPSRCGWLKDKFGISWQIIPAALPRLLADPDAGRASRAMQAMMAMAKIDVALLEAAAANGFSAGMVMGRMVHLSKDGTALLSLQFDPQAAMAEDPNAQALSSAKIVLDLPHVAEFQRPLSELRHAATALALKLDADVTDEDGRPLGEATWGQLEAQMKGLYRELEGYGVAAGSVAALKLYS